MIQRYFSVALLVYGGVLILTQYQIRYEVNVHFSRLVICSEYYHQLVSITASKAGRIRLTQARPSSMATDA